jgi:hypothetical protein
VLSRILSKPCWREQPSSRTGKPSGTCTALGTSLVAMALFSFQ